MKKILLPLFLFFTLAANATNLTVNAPSATVSSMGSLTAGDTIFVTTGNYTTLNFGGIHDVTIINKGGLVTFSGGNYIDFGLSGASMTNITFTGNGVGGLTYGFKFTNSSDAFLFTGTHNSGLRFYYIDFEGVPNNMFDCSGYSVAYDGTTGTIKMQNIAIEYCLLNNSGELWQGTYGTVTQTGNIADSVDIGNITVTQTATNGTEVAGPIMRHNLHDWYITFVGLPTVVGDVGKFQIAGNGQVHHNFNHGGRGYWCRNLSMAISTNTSAFYFYDNIDLATNAYGGIDYRTDITFFPQNANYATVDAYIYNNDIGNKTDVNGYICTFAIIGATAGKHVYVRNNLSFNTQYGANPMINDNSGGSWTSIATDTSNNKYLSAAQSVVVLADTIYHCNLASSSPLIAAGVTNSQVTTDYSYRARPNPPSISAEEYGAATTPPTLTAASSPTVDNNFNITYTDNATWRGDITQVQINGVALPSAAWATSAGILTLKPSQSSLLQVPSAGFTVTVVATTFSNATVTQNLLVGAAAKLSIATQPAGLSANPHAFATQPIVNILDQYNNQTASTASVTATATSGWTISGTVTVTAVNGVATFTNLAAAGSNTVNINITITFSSSGLPNAVSNNVILPPTLPPGCSCTANVRGHGLKYKIG